VRTDRIAADVPGKAERSMERATKLLVVGWTGAALALEVWVLRGAWPGLPLLAAGGFTGAAALAAFDRRAVAIVLACAYVFPTLTYLHLGNYHPQYNALWMALLFGAILPRTVRSSWHLPGLWRSALICWALVVIVGASVVVVREVDFNPQLIHVTTVANTAGGGWPAFIVGWVVHVALIVLIGILWFDWVLGTTSDEFHVSVAMPLAASCAALGLVAIYQMFVDLSFLNLTVFGSMARATGTVFDANVCGAIGAMWIGGFVLCGQPLGRWRAPAVGCGVGIGWLTVWASGSRTAFAAATIVTVFSMVALQVPPWRSRRFRLFIPAVLAAAGAGLFVLAKADLDAVGPLQRLLQSIPDFSADTLQAAAKEQLWTRNGYGTASTAMIRQYPWFGVGVGSFQSLLSEFAPLTPDNAQNWYRHQLAELGVVGSAAWIAWLVGFGTFVLRPRANQPAIAWTARGVLVAFAAISFVGMPGQDTFVAITFWTMAAWYVKLAAEPFPAPARSASWVATAAVVLLFASGSVYAASTDLRVPVRAQRVGWPYTYGFYPPEVPGGDERWTRGQAVAVLEAPTPWMALTVSVDYRRIGSAAASAHRSHVPTRAVEVKVWRDGQLVLDRLLSDTAPVTAYIPVTGVERWVMLETDVSRLLRPADFGIADDRELGMIVKWTFVDGPPAAD
jgi:hypothetical protein